MHKFDFNNSSNNQFQYPIFLEAITLKAKSYDELQYFLLFMFDLTNSCMYCLVEICHFFSDNTLYRCINLFVNYSGNEEENVA